MDIHNIPNFTWPQVAVIGILVFGFVMWTGFLWDGIKIRIGKQK